MGNYFSVPIFFILFRESLEASIIVSVLLGLVEQIARSQTSSAATTLVERKTTSSDEPKESPGLASGHELAHSEVPVSRSESQRLLIRKMRIQIFLGAGIGLAMALAIGAAFLVVYYVKLSDLFASAEDLWEGCFSLVASLMIFAVGIAMLQMDRAKAKWRVKLGEAFNARVQGNLSTQSHGRGTKYALLLLPLITVLREGLEAVIFVGGVSLGQEAKSIPIAAIAGLACGLLVGVLIWLFSGRLNISVFMVASTCVLLLIGSGLFSKAIGSFQTYSFVKLVGADVAEAGDGPGSFRVQGNVWHLPYGNPENKLDGQGWSIFNAILGWSNNATLGTVLGYVFYWLAVIATLVYLKWSEGRLVMFGHESKLGRARRERREARQLESQPELELPAPGSRIGTPLQSPALEERKELVA